MRCVIVPIILSLALSVPLAAEPAEITAETLRGLELRSIGPALMGGRIADIAVDPVKPNTWYVAAGSGNLWKTVNAGTTWTPIFEHYGSYSIGCVTVDPRNPHDVVDVVHHVVNAARGNRIRQIPLRQRFIDFLLVPELCLPC